MENIPEPIPSRDRAGKSTEIKYWVVFDEFQKYPCWKETLKGLFDEFGSSIRFVVCGRLFSFNPPSKEFKEAVYDLYRLTGFPEPFLTGREDFYRRWRDEHLSILATEEVRDLSKISDFVRLQNLTFLLPEKVGSTLSVNNLA